MKKRGASAANIERLEGKARRGCEGPQNGKGRKKMTWD